MELRDLAAAGQRHFDALLAGLPDSSFTEPSILPGWTRSHVIAHIGLNARGLANLARWAATGVETPMYESQDRRNSDIEEWALRTPAELRELAASGRDTLDAAWDALDATTWQAQVRGTTGPPYPATGTVWKRAKEAWIHSVDLDAGADFDDLPAEFLALLLDEINSAWGGSPVLVPAGPAESGVIAGTPADLAAWATGRYTRGVTTRGELPPPPPWM